DPIERELGAAHVDPPAIVDDAVRRLILVVERDRDALVGRLDRRLRVMPGAGRNDEERARGAHYSSTATVSPTSFAASRGSARPASTAATPVNTGMRTRSLPASSAPASAARAPSVRCTSAVTIPSASRRPSW